MATAYGLEPVAGGPAFNAMADCAPERLEIEPVNLPVEPPRRAAPPPNPNFSFPAAPASAPPALPRSTVRRPRSAIDSPTDSFHLAADVNEQPTGREALPAFSFNPGASLPPTSPMPSPPLSPPSPRALPSSHRPAGHGHRRGGSEFVGGRIRDGNSIAVLNDGSPTKPESGFASPNQPPRRRGHRRGVSSALSTNDLSLLPPPKHDFDFKGSSAPNSPTNFEIPAMPPLPKEFMPKPQEPAPQVDNQPEPEVGKPEETPSETEDSTQPKPVARARVGFSDTLEYIPRPLSLVSTDTSSTITAKPGHAVSGSISSVVTGSIPTGRDSPASLSRSPSHTENADTSRPSTAGAILERTPTVQGEESNVSPRRRNSIPALLDMAEAGDVASPEASPTKSRRWTFFGLDPFSASLGSPNKTRPHSASSGDSATRVVSGTSSSDQGSESANDVQDAKEPKQGKKKSKRRKIVQGWAGSILPRKSKQQKSSKYTVRPPTPPASVLPPDEDEDDAMDIDSPQHQPAPTVTVTASPDPPPAPRRAEDTSAMIDLDAALGPFNTPLPDNPEWDAAQRAAGNVGRRRLHSAQGMRGFSGPGMHYHRRAESAPDLPPFDPGASSSIHRFGSNSTMADVFEEDEEEDTTEVQSQSGTPSQSEKDSDGDTTPPAVAPEPVKEAPRIVRRKSSGLSDNDQSSIASVRAQHSRTSLHENVIMEEPGAIPFRPNSTFGGSDASGSPRLSPRKTFGNKELPSFELGAPSAPYSNTPVSPHSMSYASSPRSPMSADTQRLSTAPSSVHEENSFQSLLLGEPGPEVRLSMDYDIPSLTSSNSTMTRDSNTHPHTRMSQPSLREPRPLSVSSAAFGRRRSSLVSLSRLISSSHGERSKLSMEVTLDNEAENRKPRSKKKRFGRLVQFWKPKDGATS